MCAQSVMIYNRRHEGQRNTRAAVMELATMSWLLSPNRSKIDAVTGVGLQFGFTANNQMNLKTKTKKNQTPPKKYDI